ncbi:MAG: T9SS type A sorting domain-containing protein [Cyclobacteriaceae bacterium]
MKCLFILFTLIISYLSKAQETGNIITASGEAKGISISASWAIGEVINETFKSSSFEVSHGLNDQNFKYVITGTKEKDELLIYPMPFEKSFNIVSSDRDLSGSVITLFDATGKQVNVQLQRVHSNQITISFEHSAPGLYLLLIQSSGSIKPLSFKLIKE